MKFSLIVPIYNSEKYIETCIESFYQQDLPLSEYEVICVNDCSPDNSAEIVKKLQEKYSNLLYIEHIDNKRTGGARNTGISHSKGEYLWFIDADDFIMPNILVKLYEILSTYNLEVLHFGFNEYILDELKINKTIDSTDVVDGSTLFFDKDFIWWKDHITVWPKVYRKEFLIKNQILFKENLLYEDNDFSIRVYANANRVMHISENLYVYRNNNSSITHQKYNPMYIEEWGKLIEVLSQLRKSMKNKYDNRYQYELRKFITNLIVKTHKSYNAFSAEEKILSNKNYKKILSISCIPYIGIFKYIKMKFNIL